MSEQLGTIVSYNSYTSQKYIKLAKEYEELKIELDELKKECEENTIINSMNDMKKSYEIQQKKIEYLKNYINEVNSYTRTAKVMINVICTNIPEYGTMRSSRQELHTRLEFVIEMLDIISKKKNELLYLEYDL